MAVSKELMSIPDFGSEDETAFATERKSIINMKKAILMTAGAAVQKLMMQLSKEQEVLMNIADMIITVYVAESVMLRVEKLVAKNGDANCGLQLDMMRTYIFDADDTINKAGKDAICSFAEGDELRMMLMGIKRFTKVEPLNTKMTRQRIAQKMIDENKYCF
jgi:hypothetical protein